MKSAFDVVAEVSKLIKKSPKRDAAFERLKADLATDTPGFRVLCPTRWTVRAASLKSVIDNYEVLLSVWQEALCGSLDGEMRARIIGVETQMTKFDFFFGVQLGSLILRHSDNLSSTLQHESLSAAEGHRIAMLTVAVLQKIRTDENFTAFYQRVLAEQSRLGVDDPCLPRKRRFPQRYQVGSSRGDFHSSPETYYRQIYFGALDNAIEAIRDRFDQPGYAIYQNLEELVIKASKGEAHENELEFVCKFYKDDLSRAQLEAQLPLLEPLCEGTKNITIHDIVKILGGLSAAERVAISSVYGLL